MSQLTPHTRILETLHDLRRYALQKARPGMEIGLIYHEEDSALMRFANSAISLNTREHLIRLEITAQQGRQRASYELITDLSQQEAMRAGVDTAIELAQHAQPLTYQPSVPVYAESFHDESAYDPELAQMENADCLAFVNQAAAGLETDEVRLAGIFSHGATTHAMLYTTSEHAQFFRFSDAQVSLTLAHNRLKWEVIAEASAQRRSDLDAARLHQELKLLWQHMQDDPHFQLPLGRYEVVFGPAAIAAMLEVMSWIGFDGGIMKRGFSFLRPEQIGQKVFSEQFSLADDPSRRETFPFRRDRYGMRRERFPIVEQGVFRGFLWGQDDADEFGAQPTGHSVPRLSLALAPGEQGLTSLADLIANPAAQDRLYIPYLHYMNIVNPSQGVITASSRFGTLLLRSDGSVAAPYNVRLTPSLLEVFGEKLSWLSQAQVAYNTSSSYGRRNPSAVVTPSLMAAADLEVTFANESF